MNKQTLEEDLRAITMRFYDLERELNRPHRRKGNRHHWKEDVELDQLNTIVHDLRRLRMACRGLFMEAIERHENKDLT